MEEIKEVVETNDELEPMEDYDEESEAKSKLGLGILLGAGIAGVGALAYKKVLKPGVGFVKDKIKSHKDKKKSEVENTEKDSDKEETE